MDNTERPTETAPVTSTDFALSPDDVAAYHAVQSSAVVWESPFEWSSFRGDKAVETLNGLVTNDVGALVSGGTVYAAALSPKGKLVTDMHIVRVNDTTLFIGVPRATAPEWLALTKKYVNPRLSTVTDESAAVRSWIVYGPRTRELTALLSDHGLLVVGTRDAGTVPGVLVITDSSNATATAHVENALQHIGAHAGSATVWNVVRMESGFPHMGVDMDENTIPQEANLDILGAISFSKGCYTGQETVARVHFRGHVNKHLRGLVGGNTPLQAGAGITDTTGKVVGMVKSVAQSPKFGAIALAMVRREVDIGATVQVATPSGVIPVQVLALPF
jgi:folate-binding protein YgfZ